MGRRCTICDHPDREEIERRLIVPGFGEEASLRKIAERFNVGETALHRHKHQCIEIAKFNEVKDKQREIAGKLLGEAREYQEMARQLLEQSIEESDRRSALGALKELRGYIELLGKFVGEIHQGDSVTIINNPQWIELKGVVLTALEPYPEARRAVAHSLALAAGGESEADLPVIEAEVEAVAAEAAP